MGYQDRIAECNAHDLRRYVPFAVAGRGVGFVRKDRVPRLLDVADAIVPTATGLALRAELADVAARTAAIDALCDELRALGELPPRHGERYPAVRAFGAEPVFTIDRSAVSWFGLRAFGVHVNGYVRTPRGLAMWLAERSRSKPTWPGMLDQVVAGGQPVGLSLQENLVKECAEEAGIPAELAARAVPVGSVRYCMENERGLKPDEMFCYDLLLPYDFVPRAVDGEVERFVLLPLEEVRALVRDTRRIKPNCNLVILDFLLRHGEIEGSVETCDAMRAALRPALPLPEDG